MRTQTLLCRLNDFHVVSDACRIFLFPVSDAQKGKYDGYLLEGMACPGGCVGGAGTMQGPTKAKGQIVLTMKKSKRKKALESTYKDKLDLLAER